MSKHPDRILVAANAATIMQLCATRSRLGLQPVKVTGTLSRESTESRIKAAATAAAVLDPRAGRCRLACIRLMLEREGGRGKIAGDRRGIN